ncbi:hypothetical protein HDU97_005946 [Phlyctochytrium planicorne]|nr:hypothetical protein HDU97_005946 [Phlyctochytrium planicorne]
MTRLANRSIDLIRDLSLSSNNSFRLQETGYVFLSAHKEKMESYAEMAEAASLNGSGDTRFHTSLTGLRATEYGQIKDGIDLVDNQDLIRQLVPGCAPDVEAMMHVRKAGFLDVFQLGKLIVERAAEQGVSFVKGTVEDVIWSQTSSTKRSMSAVKVLLSEGSNITTEIKTGAFVVASGPYLREMGEKCGVDFPVINELHARVAIRDPLGVVPSNAAFTIWSDDIKLPFTPFERKQIEQAHNEQPTIGFDKLLDVIKVPGIAGAHARPLVQTEDGGVRQFFGIWTYDNDDIDDNVIPKFPPPIPPLYGLVVLRGLSRMFPGLRQYFESAKLQALGPKSFMETTNGCALNVESGYYCKTEDNTPLLGRIPFTSPMPGIAAQQEGLFSCAGVSGFGVMCSQAAGEGVALDVLDYLGCLDQTLFTSESWGSDLEGKVGLDGHPFKAFTPMRFILPQRFGAKASKQEVSKGKLRTANQL